MEIHLWAGLAKSYYKAKQYKNVRSVLLKVDRKEVDPNSDGSRGGAHGAHGARVPPYF